MISGIRKAFINNLPTVKWMDSTTAVSAVEKVRFFCPSILNGVGENYNNFDILHKT